MEYLIDFIVLVVLYIFIFYKRWKKKGKDILCIYTIVYIYLTFVLALTLMPIIVSIPTIFNHSYIPMNLTPFVDVFSGRGDFIRQLILNVIMTIPFGFLIPLVIKGNKKFIKTVVYCFLLSLIIELLQPLINGVRSSDITDLITNVIGGVIGYMVYLVFNPLTIKILNYIKGAK